MQENRHFISDPPHQAAKQAGLAKALPTQIPFSILPTPLFE